MGIFGRRSARQRLRSAARESLTIPAFSAPVDCSAWVLGGVWPAELATITPATSQLADYLNADLQRIADSANEKLHSIGRSGLAGPARQAAEARVINVARAFAVLRVESTVRLMHNEALEFRAEYAGLNPAPPPAWVTEQIPVRPVRPRPIEPPPAAPNPLPRAARHRMPTAGVRSRADDDPPTAAMPPVPAVAETEQVRLQRLLAFVARQEPGLRWAVGTLPDGTTLLVTDLAGGWIPSGIEVPAEVGLLQPDRRTDTATAMLGAPTASAAYQPGDRLSWAGGFGATEASVRPRELAVVEDLGRRLGEAIGSRGGLPPVAGTLVEAGTLGTAVSDNEIEALRVHLDTARYQLLAQYPDTDVDLVLNTMLLAAAEGIAAGDAVSANYHYGWFRALSTSSPGDEDPQTERVPVN